MTDQAAKMEPSVWIPAIRKKKATVLRLEILDMVKTFGVNSVVTLTLSFAEFLDRATAMKRWHSLSAHLMREQFKCWVWVIERAPVTGRLHFHVAAVLHGAQDVRTGFDFGAYGQWKVENQKGSGANLGRKKALSRQYALHATPDLRALWRVMSPARMKRYGFGIAHVVPVKKNGEAFAFYMAKYLSKPTETVQRYLIEDKGHRSYGVCGKSRAASIHHSPVTKRSSEWRKRVKFSAGVIGEVVLGRSFTHDELAEYCGPRWCYYFKGWMSWVPLDYIKWRAILGRPYMEGWLGKPGVIKHEGYEEAFVRKMQQGMRAEDYLIQEFLKFYNGEHDSGTLSDGVPGTSLKAGLRDVQGIDAAGKARCHAQPVFPEVGV